MWFLKTRTRSLSSFHSLRDRIFGSSSYSLPLPRSDQYPFPTDPELVRKARHCDYPTYLPKSEASVSEVRYFLYTLLTSKRNVCAKQYPEWVLETCIAWNGNGDDLRSCSEDQLAAICPLSAQACHIDSRRHITGMYVPVPARNMIGRTIVGCVAELKTREKQSEGLNNFYPNQERPPSPAGTSFYTQSRRTPSLYKTDVDPSTVHSGAIATYCPMPPVAAYSPDAWMPSTTARYRPPRLRQARTSVPHLTPQRSKNSLSGSMVSPTTSSRQSSVTSNTRYYRTSSSVSESTAHTSTQGSLDDSKLGTSLHDPEKKLSPTLFRTSAVPAAPYSRGHPGDGGLLASRTWSDLNTINQSYPDKDRVGDAGYGTVPPRNPQRYAPRRPSALRVSSTRLGGQDTSPYSAVQQLATSEDKFANAGPRCETQTPDHGSKRWQSMGVLPNILIAEEVSKGSKQDREGIQQHVRIDSANHHVSSVRQSSSDSSSAVHSSLSKQSLDPMFIRPTSPTSVVSMSQSNSNRHLQQTWSIPRPASTMPFSNHDGSLHTHNTGVARSATPASGLRSGMPNRAGTPIDRQALATVPTKQLMNDHNATLEAEYRAFKLVAGGGSVPTPRKSTGMREEHSMTPHGLGRDIGATLRRPRTMMEVIEEKEKLRKMPLWNEEVAMRRPRSSLR
jgi:hypothetical protein